MCGVFLFRFFQDRGSLFRIIQDWIFPFRFFRFRFRRSGLLQDGVLDGAELAVGVADPLADHIAVFLQLPHPGADTVNAILADPGQPLGGIVPLLRQGEHEGEKALRFQRERLVPQVMVGHHRVIASFLNAEYRHVGYLLPLVLKSVRFGGFAPLYHRPASHEGKDMGGLVCAAHRRKIRGFPTLKRTLDFGIEKGRLSSKQPPDRGSNTSYLLSGKPGNH